MSDLSLEGQESKEVLCNHDQPPHYCPSQPSQDLLTFIIETEHTGRILLQRLLHINNEVEKLLEKQPRDESSSLVKAKWSRELGSKCIESGQISIDLADVFETRAGENSGLYIALSKLTESEFNQTYASLKRDNANRQIQHTPAGDNQNGINCHERDSGNHHQSALMTSHRGRARDYNNDSLSSSGRFLDLSARVDQINEKLDKSLLSHDKADISKRTGYATAKSPRRLWKRILKHQARP
ncbi:uncharacterized protein N7496_012014 [Penicillium cataractarum]|uniref:Uncharacterized protein n=1 Tax=Penicillium cataractarum TaxID=2100454 RepID=A0A9W9RGB9_9EURO|nr:uncharacterized protein N7496_012014 [Penicillium cataractarum]KAJ5359601.1 hypothetical protein N7496_012014 [Penicillium cataractarum]